MAKYSDLPRPFTQVSEGHTDQAVGYRNTRRNDQTPTSSFNEPPTWPSSLPFQHPKNIRVSLGAGGQLAIVLQRRCCATRHRSTGLLFIPRHFPRGGGSSSQGSVSDRPSRPGFVDAVFCIPVTAAQVISVSAGGCEAIISH